MTINYKVVNNCTVFDAFPLQKIDDLISKLSTAQYFSSLDFQQCYHQLKLLPSDQPKTAFTANGKLYHYLRCPFGLKNAVAHCSRMMQKLFEGIEGVIVYLDDVLVFGADRAAHDKTLKSVFERIKEANLSLNHKKCSFSLSSICFLGYIISNGTAKPDETRTEPIKNFPLPTSVKSLQRFLGMCTYYSKYIPSFSNICKPLYDRVSDFRDWQNYEIDAFNALKAAISKAILVILTSCLLYTSPSPRDGLLSRMPSSA